MDTHLLSDASPEITSEPVQIGNCKHHLATVYLKQLHRRALAAAFKGGLVISPER
jgi:hypothetical protein